MRTNRYMLITVISATILFFVLWQTAVAGPPMKPGNPGVPGLLAEIAELNAQIEELEDLLSQLQNFAPVSQTGQTICYDTPGSIIDCAGTGQDGEYQYGTPWPEPRFTDNLDGTVTDNLTRLMWLKDARRGCFETRAWQDALDTVADFNANPGDYICAEYTAIYNDWRLPNLNELKSLVHSGCNSPSISNTAGTACWWDGDPFFGGGGRYWSGTTSNRDPRAAWTLDFTHGQSIPHDKTNTERASVWPVRDSN